MKSLKKFLLQYRFFLLIIVIIFLSWILLTTVKKGENMNPPISQNALITPVSLPSQSKSSNQTSVDSKIWQINFAFDTQAQHLTVKNITILNGTANPVENSKSPYKLLVLDNSQRILFQTDITIAQQILYDIYFPPGSSPSSLPQLQMLNTLVTVPYFANGQTIEVKENGQTILSFSPPKEISFFKFPSLVNQADAATCSPLHIVFISDGYTDMNKFHTDVQNAEATFTSKAPFSSHADIFDFQTVDNPSNNSLGCKKNGTLDAYCVYDNRLSNISKTVFSALPALPHDSMHTKIVVLVDGGPQPITAGNVTGYILGVANALGGQFGVFQDQKYFETTATMEVLGHDVGELYDRYIYPSVPGTASEIGKTFPAPYASNCSTNPQGESFWKSAGVTTTYKGCTSQYLYAPAPLTCGALGSNTTIMSAAGCAGDQFDGVEQYYLQSVILPRYCKFAATPTLTPSNPIVQPTIASGGASTKTFKCVVDPQCEKSNTNLQICQLKCTPQ